MVYLNFYPYRQMTNLQRYVPFFSRVRILFFAKNYGFLAWSMLVMTISLFYFMLPDQDYSPLYLHSESPTVMGKITHIQRIETEGSVRYKFSYTFTTPEGKPIKGIAYSSEKKYKKDNEVPILYYPTKPSYCKIKGLDAQYSSFNTTLIQLIFFSFGVGSSVFAFYKGYQDGLNKLELIANGEICYGVYFDCQKDDEKDKENDLYRVFFEYEIDGERYELITTTSNPDKFKHLTNRVILYDRQNPKHAVFQDEI